MTWPPPLFLNHTTWNWTIDLTRAGVTPAQLEGLDWATVSRRRVGLESGDEANPTEHRQVGHYWLRDPLLAPTMGQAQAIGDARDQVKDFADDIRAGKRRSYDGRPFTHLIHVGIGGSVLGPAFIIRALSAKTPGLTVDFVDNIDPDGILQLLERRRAQLDQTLVVVASKSGSTVETMGATKIIREVMEGAGIDFPLHAIAVTTRGSPLDRLSVDENWLQSFYIWDWVGGRFSATSAIGLLSCALAGVDIAALLEGAREMDRWTRSEPWSANPAALIAGALYVTGSGRGEKNLAVLPYVDRLHLFARYLQQLLMESIGKRYALDGQVVEQGLTVYGYKGSTDQHAYMQQLRDGRNDTLVFFVQSLEDDVQERDLSPAIEAARHYLQGFLLGTRRALEERERPSLLLTMPRIDPHNLGALLALSERVVSLYSDLIGVNGYDQPGVEAGKTAAQEIIALRAKLHQRLRQGAATLVELAETTGEDKTDIFYIIERDVANGALSRSGERYSKN
jgi:glucose-6-phosphate isomerase